ncbi:PREDICTED: EF-hand domain-containing protein D1 isoform X2 [Capra hircus]|uniref:EF-hand domain-containing protein D1 isoform X2 n=1 Tax=Capra hircus TaxID=9925 RepID=UPI000846B6F2|nr:PREDICTED: EF-hand domain-containing protein D1 isoform X2 [Capra hircus]
MASEELASKLQRRLQWEEGDSGLQSAPGAAPDAEPQPQPPAWAPTARADAELSAQLNRRLDINEGAARPRSCRVFHPYSEFPEFSRRLIKDLESMFKLYDAGRDGFIDLMELKLMMEKLGAPQTHLGLKSMIKEVDEDFDGKLSFREVQALSCASKFEAELKAEQDERKREEEKRKVRQAAFRELKAAFSA